MSPVRIREVLKPRQIMVVAALLLGTASIGATAWAMRVAPMVSELTTTGIGSAARIEVGNVGASPMPFETMVTRMELDADENLIETPGDDNFLVFPPQGLVGVGGRQIVRVQWVGAPDLQASESYYLWVKQLPVATSVDPDEAEIGAAQIQVLYTMKALMVVAPPGAEPIVNVKSVEVITMSEETPAANASEGAQAAVTQFPGIRVTVNNTGRRYALMAGATWTVTGTDTAGQPVVKTYSDDEISTYVGVGFLPPLTGQRRFELRTPAALDPEKPIAVTFSR